MWFGLKAYSNYDWIAIPHEAFGDYRAARARAAALLRAVSERAAMVAVVCLAEGTDKGRVIACLTARASAGARATEWPGVWEWARPVGEVEQAAYAPAR